VFQSIECTAWRSRRSRVRTYRDAGLHPQKKSLQIQDAKRDERCRRAPAPVDIERTVSWVVSFDQRGKTNLPASASALPKQSRRVGLKILPGFHGWHRAAQLEQYFSLSIVGYISATKRSSFADRLDCPLRPGLLRTEEKQESSYPESHEDPQLEMDWRNKSAQQAGSTVTGIGRKIMQVRRLRLSPLDSRESGWALAVTSFAGAGKANRASRTNLAKRRRQLRECAWLGVFKSIPKGIKLRGRLRFGGWLLLK